LKKLSQALKILLSGSGDDYFWDSGAGFSPDVPQVSSQVMLGNLRSMRPLFPPAQQIDSPHLGRAHVRTFFGRERSYSSDL
jgi:hypothetical protein